MYEVSLVDGTHVATCDTVHAARAIIRSRIAANRRGYRGYVIVYDDDAVAEFNAAHTPHKGGDEK